MRHHVIVIHRWTDRYADYAAYVDHTVHRVSYVTTEPAARHLPVEQAAGLRLVDSTEDEKAVRAAVDALTEQVGPPTRVVALQETDLDLAARLRDELGLPGPGGEQLHPLRDKLVMARRLRAAGVPVPVTAAAGDHTAVSAFASQHGWPVLLKPRRGTASAGITRLDTAEQLARYTFPSYTDMLVQPWVPDDVLHVDGVFTGGDLGPWRASRYLNTCWAFTMGSALGSVEIDDPELLARIGDITAAATRALLSGPSVFHLELFASGSGGLTVLEIGARPGGAEIPFVWRDVHGVDLMAAAIAHQTGAPDPTPPALPRPAAVAGWLLVPPSAPVPCRVEAVTVPEDGGAYAHAVPEAGALMTGGGYEHAGARFRFSGASSAEVAAAIRRTAERTRLTTAPVDPGAPARLVVVGCGNPPYRRYALESAAAHVETALVQPHDIDWQRPYVADRYRAADTADADVTTRAVAGLLTGRPGPGAVLTWDETLLDTTAEVARRLGLPHMSPRAVRGCRDKLTTRRILTAAGVPSAGFRHVRGREEALAAAEALGLPVVVKPRALAGSIGVAVAGNAEQVAHAYEQAVTSSFPGIDRLDGAIVEEYLAGPEISVDCAVSGGEVRVMNVAHKRLGFAPYFEEVGHLVKPWDDEPWADEVRAVLTAAHEALGIRTGVTHTELRLTGAGPRIVEVNGRLGGDFIPLLGRLATGVDQIAAAADLALGRAPAPARTHDRCAEVRFVYPDHDAVVRSLDVDRAAAEPGIERAVALAGPGTALRLPPHGIVPRLAALVAVGDTPQECATALDRAQRAVRCALDPLGALDPPGAPGREPRP
ncbi:ATP-grasp domain-containing protein [Streptomyces sp. PKU-MA01144]|uniref:ATP-grasp domain-containing protein n=1 Tax=Streptomyces sp. PKU-MA01144 TaxID=2729138 RepID=UPI00148173D1|nr:ATP-grasp domain-containing protein [Streptomyces sp. PKU-MA01144]NNJ06192.1 ATP-grasp domain-containing protein [Streptomyces sp. PKU-MA01144]